MRFLISFLFFILLSLNSYSQQESLPEYQGGEEAFKDFITRGLTLPDSVGFEIYSFQLNICGMDGRIELAESNASFSDEEMLNSQFLELIKKMPKWDIKDKTTEYIEIRGYLTFSSDGVKLEFNKTYVSNLTTIEEIFTHLAANRDENSTTDIDMTELIDLQAVIDEDVEIKELNSAYDKVVEEAPFISVEQMPSYPGGNAEMMKFVSENFKMPFAKKGEEIICTRIAARFIVEADGSISNIHLLRSCHEKADEAIVAMIKKMPKWIPGKQNGKNVPVYFILPIHLDFRLTED